MIEKRLLQTERLDFSQLNIRANAHFAGIVRASCMKSPSVSPSGLTPWIFTVNRQKILTSRSIHCIMKPSKGEKEAGGRSDRRLRKGGGRRKPLRTRKGGESDGTLSLRKESDEN